MKTIRFVTFIVGFVLATNATFSAGIGSLSAISVRVQSGAGSGSPIIGFQIPQSISGTSREVLCRAMGPSLAQFGVPGVMPHPTLALYDQNTGALVGCNNNWASGDPSELRQVARDVSAFPFTDGLSDAALVNNMPGGLYSAVAAPADGVQGIVLQELYRGTTGWNGTVGFVSVSCRGITGPGASVLILGFVVVDDTLPVLLRGTGPTLAKFGVDNTPDAVTITLFQLYQGNTFALVPDGTGNWIWKLASTLRAGEVTNDGWSSDPANAKLVAAHSQNNYAFPLPVGSKDSAVVVTLSPGVYTLQVSAKNDPNNRVALAEVYALYRPLPPVIGTSNWTTNTVSSY